MDLIPKLPISSPEGGGLHDMFLRCLEIEGVTLKLIPWMMGNVLPETQLAWMYLPKLKKLRDQNPGIGIAAFSHRAVASGFPDINYGPILICMDNDRSYLTAYRAWKDTDWRTLLGDRFPTREEAMSTETYVKSDSGGLKSLFMDSAGENVAKVDLSILK